MINPTWASLCLIDPGRHRRCLALLRYRGGWPRRKTLQRGAVCRACRGHLGQAALELTSEGAGVECVDLLPDGPAEDVVEAEHDLDGAAAVASAEAADA